MVLSFAKSRRPVLDIWRPTLFSLAGATATWAAYRFIRGNPSRLTAVTSQLRKFLLRSDRERRRISQPAAPKSAAPQPSTPEAATDRARPVAARDWIHAMHEVMEREPREFGFDKPDWNAPLLSRYLQKEHGQEVPVHRIRDALKESGYQWRYQRYHKPHG